MLFIFLTPFLVSIPFLWQECTVTSSEREPERKLEQRWVRSDRNRPTIPRDRYGPASRGLTWIHLDRPMAASGPSLLLLVSIKCLFCLVCIVRHAQMGPLFFAFCSYTWLYIAQRSLVAWRVTVSDIDSSSHPSPSCNLAVPHLSVGSVRNPSSAWRHVCILL